MSTIINKNFKIIFRVSKMDIIKNLVPNLDTIKKLIKGKYFLKEFKNFAIRKI
jgi:hypothetical protein